MDNRYFVHLPYQDEAVPWDPLQQPLEELSSYFRFIIRSLEQRLKDRGLTFHITWKIDRLPSTGTDVVAIVMADEWAQMPAYALDVLCTFKCYGVRQYFSVSPGDLARASGWAELARDVRVGLASVPHVVRHRWRSFQTGRSMRDHPVYPLPIGYGNQEKLPIKPVSERTTDVFFAGSVQHSEKEPQGLRRYIRSPKVLSREQMLRRLDHTVEKHPEISVNLKLTNRFVLNAIGYGLDRPGEVYGEAEYSRRLMDSKICLAPRGTSLETFRYYEGLRYGCVVLTEAQPPHWFYSGAPAIVVDRWDELPSLIPYLLAHPDVLQQKHEQALDWWSRVASEEAVTDYMVDCIKTQLQSSQQRPAL